MDRQTQPHVARCEPRTMYCECKFGEVDQEGHQLEFFLSEGNGWVEETAESAINSAGDQTGQSAGEFTGGTKNGLFFTHTGMYVTI